MFLPSVETIPFNCHFCTHPGFPSHKEFISHLIDVHLRFEQTDWNDLLNRNSGFSFWEAWTWAEVSQAVHSLAVWQRAGRSWTTCSSTTPPTIMSSRRSCSVRRRASSVSWGRSWRLKTKLWRVFSQTMLNWRRRFTIHSKRFISVIFPWLRRLWLFCH